MEGRGDLSDEEYRKIMQLVTEQENALQSGEHLTAQKCSQPVWGMFEHTPHAAVPGSMPQTTCFFTAGNETPYSLRTKVSLAVQSAAVVLDNSDVEVMRAALQGLSGTTNIYPETMAVSVGITSVSILTPDGQFLRAGSQLHSAGSLPASGSPGDHHISMHRACRWRRQFHTTQRAHLWCAGVLIEEVECGIAAPKEGDSHDEGEGTQGAAQSETGALHLELVQKPQDGSADASVSLALSSSYIVYTAPTVERLQNFFRVEKVRQTMFADGKLAASLARHVSSCAMHRRMVVEHIPAACRPQTYMQSQRKLQSK